jgi:hypothetical protein
LPWTNSTKPQPGFKTLAYYGLYAQHIKFKTQTKQIFRLSPPFLYN